MIANSLRWGILLTSQLCCLFLSGGYAKKRKTFFIMKILSKQHEKNFFSPLNNIKKIFAAFIDRNCVTYFWIAITSVKNSFFPSRIWSHNQEKILYVAQKSWNIKLNRLLILLWFIYSYKTLKLLLSFRKSHKLVFPSKL